MSDAEDQTQGDEDSDDDSQPGPEQEVARAWSPQKLKKAARERLSDYGHAMIGDAGEITFVIRGARDATLAALRTTAQQLENLYKEFRADEELTGLAVAESIHITIAPSEQERELAAQAASELAELEDVDEDEPQRQRARLATVPNTVLAGSLLLDLIEETADPEADAPLRRALAYGTGIASSYRVLVTELGKAGLELEAESRLEDRAVRVDAERLERLGEQLSEPGDPDSFDVSGVAGVLTMADADRLEFRLKFADDIERPDVLREWKHGVITGTYTPQMRGTLTRRGLWNKDVIVKLEITREVRGTTANRQPPTVRLKSARLRFAGE